MARKYKEGDENKGLDILPLIMVFFWAMFILATR